ncbi:MAG: diguanylate cyclase [Armatimonadetes bacterium]|nr:diguanylate cyclase [Armatimonadota bacterium]NIM22863.1 diguanylate cyclase [Armatimonadota bacterium]NIM66729.1 diguanylate cyclase [Armatimonadota bacterium]NIM75286.1 diguanylate cyclase [Armatimonadota bacterium]NIN04926.1 diguanylate cyclase [Armatimonadota bacterium]
MTKGNLALKLGLILGILVTAGLAIATALLICTAYSALTQQTAVTALDSTNIVKEGIARKLREEKSIEIVADFCRVTRETDIESLFLFDAEGRLVASAINGEPAPMSEERGEYRALLGRRGAKVLKADEVGSEAWLISGPDGRQKMRTVVEVDNWPKDGSMGLLVSDVSLGPAQQAARDMLSRTLLSGGAVFILLILTMAWLMERMVYRPLRTVDEKMARLAAGELQARVPSLGNDEMGRIADGFNQMAEALEEKMERLEALATTDYLTSLLNHRGFQERLEGEACRAQRYCRSFSLLMLDIDNFKRVNDRYSHQAGDEVLKQAALHILGNCRESDSVARYGGEEFAVILPETDGSEAQALAEKLRAAVDDQPFTVTGAREPVRLTVSVGVASFPTDSTQPEGLLMAADLALLRSKSISHNIVSSYSALSRLGKIDDPYLLHRYLEEGTVESLIALVEVMENRDPYVQGHSRRVTELALEIGARISLSEAELESLRLAGLLHDIGNIGIPVGILNKPSALTEDEWRFVRTHPPVGGAILNGVEGLQEIIPVVVHHHERYNGAGYPAGLKGEDIPLLSRVLAAADAVIAMLSPRPYRPAFTFEEVVEEVYRQAGEQFDPTVAGALVRILREKAKAPTNQKAAQNRSL